MSLSHKLTQDSLLSHPLHTFRSKSSQIAFSYSVSAEISLPKARDISRNILDIPLILLKIISRSLVKAYLRALSVSGDSVDLMRLAVDFVSNTTPVSPIANNSILRHPNDGKHLNIYPHSTNTPISDSADSHLLSEEKHTAAAQISNTAPTDSRERNCIAAPKAYATLAPANLRMYSADISTIAPRNM